MVTIRSTFGNSENSSSIGRVRFNLKPLGNVSFDSSMSCWFGVVGSIKTENIYQPNKYQTVFIISDRLCLHLGRKYFSVDASRISAFAVSFSYKIVSMLFSLVMIEWLFLELLNFQFPTITFKRPMLYEIGSRQTTRQGGN